MHVPEFLKRPLSLKTLATKYWDLSAIPRPRVFEVLALDCTDELEKDKLADFLNPESQEDLYAYVNRPRRTILEVLYDFRHATATLTVQKMFEIFQPIKPRSFSIASCQEMQTLQLLVAVVEYKTILSTPRLGLCSNWLKNLKVGSKIRAWIRRGTFKLPDNPKTPLIMVGPGTGLAPFRSVLLEREAKYRDNCGPLVLFFGCRNKEMDFHCREDLKRLESSGMLKIFCAFSRDQDDKIYVQHKIREHSDLLRNLIKSENGVILVAGNSKNMPLSVKEALTEILDNDETFVEELIKKRRYQEETWG